MKKLSTILFTVLFSLGAFAQNQMQGTTLKLGSPTAVDKDLIFDIGNTTTNPKLRANATTDVLQFSNDGTNFFNLGTVTASRSVKPLQLHGSVTNIRTTRNLGVISSVAASALTVAIKQFDGTSDASATDVIDVYFRGSPVTSGGMDLETITGAKSIVVPSTATLGTSNGVAAKIYVYLIRDSGTEVCVSKSIFSDESLNSATAIDTASDSGAVLYCGSAHSSKPTRLVGKLTITEATAGTWATAASQVDLYSSSIESSVVDASSGGIVATNITATGSFVVPTGVTTLFYRICGAGGGGGGQPVSTNNGAGGGGGGEILEGIMSVSSGETLTVTIGTAGTAGSENQGGDGGNTTVVGALQSLLSYGGGGGGRNTTAGSNTGNGWTGGGANAGGGAGGGGNVGIQATANGAASTLTPIWSGGGGGCPNAGGGCQAGNGGESAFAAGGTGSAPSANRSGGGGGGGGLGAGGNGGRGAGNSPTAGGICAGGGGCGDATNTGCTAAPGGRGDVTLYYAQ